MKKPTRKSIERIKKINERKRNKKKKLFKLIRNTNDWKHNNKWLENNVVNGLNIEVIDRANILKINLPVKMNLSKNYDETVLTLNAIRRLVTLKLAIQRGGAREAYRLKSVNFDTLNQLSTSAGLVLAAEISHWNDKINKKLTPQCDGWDPAIKAQLTELGFFDLFDLQPPVINQNASHIKSIKYFKGRKGNGEMAKQLRQEIESITGKALHKSTFLYSALSEAMTNVAEHAYPHSFMKNEYWYMTGGFDTNTMELKVAFYDQGIGIPQSLPRSKLWERAKGFLASKGLTNDHPSLIKAAVEMGRTKTDKEYRGKGLQDLLEFIRQRQEGYLSIFSLKGLYKYEQHGEKIHIKTEKMKHSIQGTLIIWSVTLEN
jgi:hypothetical protein